MLKRTATAAASAVAAPYIIPSSALGLDGATAPSNRLNLGMIGMGQMMGGHLGGMLGRKEVQVLAVCDVHGGRLNAARSRAERAYADRTGKDAYRGCDAYSEHEAITRRDDIDAVFVVTPDHWHVPIALDAVRHGKDVYVEKPMTLTIQEGRALSDACRRYGRILQVGSQQRSEWAFRKAAEIVRNGWIGRIKEVYAGLGSFAPPKVLPEEPVPEELDYDRWLGPTPWRPYNAERVKGNYGGGWRCFWEYGARKNGDWGAHHYDIIQWALGMDDSGPTFFFPKGYKGSDQMGFTYPDGPTVYRDRPRPSNQMIHFIGEKGWVGVSRGGKLVTDPAEFRDQPLAAGDTRLYESTSHHQNWLDCVRSRRMPIADVEIGHRTATVCHLSAIAERLNRPVRWDPDTESIVDDAEAARWLDRPRRAPYTL